MNQTFTPPDVKTQLALFEPTDQAIAVLAEQYMPLTIAGINDAAGYALVHKARMDVKNRRCSVERVRKDLKADALDYGRKVDAEAKRLTALLEPIETHLANEEEAIDAEKERIKNAARLKAEAEAKAKEEAEAARLKAEHDAEVERLRVEREKIDAERKAMEAERAAEQAKQREAQEKLDAERRAIDAEKARLAEIENARLREIETKRREAEAAERARLETERRIAREAEEAKAKAEAEADEKKRVEALRPDREKLLGVATAIEAFVVPACSEASGVTRAQVIHILACATKRIRALVKEKLG